MKKIYFLISALIASFAVSAQCTDLFISEYAEGSSSNKYLEIYNPSSVSVDMSNYSLFMINNGGTSNNIGFTFSGMLGPHEVYVLANDRADSAGILSKADTAMSYNSVVHFNGDDAVMLIKGTDTIDIIGVRWVDPGASWSVGTGSTRDYTLVRKANIDKGQTDWSIGETEWDVYPQNTWTNLGVHSSDCAPATEPSIAAPAPTHESEDVISIFNDSYGNLAGTNFFPFWNQQTQFEVFYVGQDSMLKYSNLDYQGIEFGSDVDASNMEYLHFDIWTADLATIDIFPISRGSGERKVNKALNAGSWTSIDIPLSDYTSQGLNMNDLWQFKFDDLGRTSSTIFVDNIYFWKEPTLVYKKANIADIVGLNADFEPVNLDTLYEITGIVYGVDLQGPESNDRLAFTVIDGTDGISIFADDLDGGGTVGGYQVKEGDEVTVKGPLDFFRGLTQIRADSITLISSGNTTKEPTVVTKLNEDSESDLVMLEKVWLVDETMTMWPDRSSNIDFTNGVDTFAIRIDSDIPGVLSKPIDYDTMNIVGLGGQFDFSAPYDEGYQLLPRDSADIQEWIPMYDVTFIVDMKLHKDAGNTWTTVNLNGTFNGWCGGCAVMTDDDMDDVYEITVQLPAGEVDYKFTLDGWDAQEEFDGTESCVKTKDGFNNRFFVVEGDATIDAVCYNYCVDCQTVLNVEDVLVTDVTVYPNPTIGNLKVTGSTVWNTYEVYSLQGIKVAAGEVLNNALSVDALTAGSYILKLANADANGVSRFVVSK